MASFPQEGQDTINLLFVGDIMCHGPQFRSVLTEDGYDFSDWFRHVKDEIRSADLAIGNLETTLSPSGPYSGYPRFISPSSLADALEDVGFDVLVTSNNHSYDSGQKGVEHTIDKLKSLGLYQTGTFKSELEASLYNPLIISIKGVQIALLNYTYGTNGIPVRPPVIVNKIDSTKITKDIHHAKANNADMILAFMHWGSEYLHRPDSEQRALSEFMIKEGVDHIIGAHPHVIQPIEVQNQKEKSNLIAFSLGNFISNQKKPNTDIGLMLKVSLIHQKSNTTLHRWEPIHVWRHKYVQSGKLRYEIIPVPQFKTDTSYFDSSQSHLQMMKSYRVAEKVVRPAH